MPKAKRGPYIYQRPGRHGWYAFLDRNHKDISLHTTDEAQAREAFGALLQESRGILELASGEEPVSAIFDMCRERAVTNHTPKTTYELHLNLRRVLAWLETRGVVSAKRIDRDLVEHYKTSRRFDKVSARRINRELDSWKKAMRLAVEMRHASKPTVDDAFVKLREPRPVPHQRGLSRDQLDAFFAAVDDERYAALFRVTLGTAMRDDEVRHMQPSNVRAGIIVVTPQPAGACKCCPDGWTSKSYRHREIPVSKATVVAARAFLKERPRMSLDPKGVWKRINAACKAARVPHFSMHDLRRAWASHMLDAGHKIEAISAWLGHADLLTTMRYLRIVRHEMPTEESLPW